MVKEGDKVVKKGKTYYVLRRKFGRIHNYYLFTPEELRRADARFRRFYDYK